jgi:hypothetical protein
MNTRPFATLEEAKEFFVQRVCTEANFEGSPLKSIEVEMLKWSADYSVPGVPDDDEEDVYDRFSKQFDRWEWEGKIQRLLINAYEREFQVDPDAKSTYKEAYRMLRKEDHYILGIIKPALGSQLSGFLGIL